MAKRRKREPCFFKILLGDFSEKIRIPPAFVKNFCGEIINVSVLRCHNGKVWPVKVMHDGNSFFLQEGWQDFVKRNSIKVGEFLVFRYDGHSGFNVQIFGKSGCEKLESLPHDKKKKKTKVGAVCKCKYIYKSVEGVEANGGGNPMEKASVEFTRKKVFYADECPFQLKNPHFTAQLRPNTPYTVRIPKVFVREFNLARKLTKCFRDENGRTWPINIIHSCNRSDFSSGWHDFRVANCLGEGDRCIFEFVEDGIIQIHVFRHNELLVRP